MNEVYYFKGKRADNNEWIGGLLTQMWGQLHIVNPDDENTAYPIIPETIGQCTGLRDKNGKLIFKWDIVKIVDFQVGVVTQECGAFGVSIIPRIDWDYLDSEIAEITGCDNMSYFCRNDNFISLWELMWNYNQEENYCEVVEVIGNIHDNPELLEVEK